VAFADQSCRGQGRTAIFPREFRISVAVAGAVEVFRPVAGECPLPRRRFALRPERAPESSNRKGALL